MAGIMLIFFRPAVACRMFSGISSALESTECASVLNERQKKSKICGSFYSRVDYKDGLSPVPVLDEVQQELGVGCGDVQRVNDVKIFLGGQATLSHEPIRNYFFPYYCAGTLEF